MKSKEESYKEMREFTCVCCGNKVMLTKFASAKTAKCQKCKDEGKEINPDLVPTQSPKATKSEISGNTKTLPCVKCGTMVEVSKFMSAAKVLCPNCKGDSTTSPSGKLKVDISKINRDTMPTVEDYNVLPSNIANKKLRSVICPACGEEHMRIINILDYSSFGLIIHYQCNKCKTLVSVSEQCKFRCRTQKIGHLYDYSGHEIENLMSAIDGARVHSTLDKLYSIIKEHNIPLEGIELPPYLYEEDKPVPVGFEIPPTDIWVKTIEDVVQMLDKSQRMGEDVDMPEGARYITISDTLAKQVSFKLKQLFKEIEEKE
jgi:DNA-directed RNA polymerase subunit M/transcription elongation factor TFIIS